MHVSVIIPVHDSREHLEAALAGLRRSARPPDEVLVVDDGSTQDLGPTVRDAGARRLRLAAPPSGPAAARNAGAASARGDLLVFIDADVVVHPDALGLMVRRFEDQSDVAALFGSYDDRPPRGGVVSRYKNLLHHDVHQHARREASTFWAGCGAVRREAFEAVGGFSTRFTRPSIEDIELGVRLRDQGYRLRLCPDIQATHLKRWTLAGLLRTDIFARALPWSRLICERGRWPADLNVDARSRWSAVAVLTGAAMLPLGLVWPVAWLGVPAAAGVVGAANRRLLVFFGRRGGWRFALVAWALHMLYSFYSSTAFTLVCLHHRVRRGGATPPALPPAAPHRSSAAASTTASATDATTNSTIRPSGTR